LCRTVPLCKAGVTPKTESLSSIKGQRSGETPSHVALRQVRKRMRQGRVGIVGWSEERKSVCEAVETAESVPKRRR
jgi:hypothetical protein